MPPPFHTISDLHSTQTRASDAQSHRCSPAGQRQLPTGVQQRKGGVSCEGEKDQNGPRKTIYLSVRFHVPHTFVSRLSLVVSGRRVARQHAWEGLSPLPRLPGGGGGGGVDATCSSSGSRVDRVGWQRWGGSANHGRCWTDTAGGLYASSHHLFSSRTCASSSGVKSLTMLKVLRISSGVLPLIIDATLAQVRSRSDLMSM